MEELVMQIQRKDDGKKGMFYIEQEGEVVASMDYVWSGDKIIIDHTMVSEAMIGKGTGKKLLSAVVEFAREKGIKILPLCPFARAVFDKTPEYKDVLF
jgi:uncharacterized protein